MRLSKKEDWQYQDLQISSGDINRFIHSNEWVNQVLKQIPHGQMNYLELGCSPGICSAALTKDTDWLVSGVDYSESGTVFLKTLSLVGKAATFHQSDIFEFKARELYDIVASYGLIEHFGGGSLDRVLDIHDECLKPGGYLVIELPNFTGFQYFWHFLFDKPNLDIHNIDIMSPAKLAKHYQAMGYEILFCDYVGCLQVWGSSKFGTFGKIIVKLIEIFINKVAYILNLLGLNVSGESCSPAIILCAKKPL